MLKEILVDIVRQVWPLILAAVVIYINWLIMLSLGLQLNRIKVKKEILLCFTLVIAVGGFIGKQALSVESGFFCAMILFFLSLKILSRLSWIQILVTAFICLLLSIFGKIALTRCFRYFYGGLENYFTYQSLVIICRGLVESVFPGFILLAANVLDISFVPFKKKTLQSGLLMIGLFTALIFLSSIVFMGNNSLIQKGYDLMLLQILARQLFMATAMVTLLLLIRSHLLKEKERELDEERLKESRRLLDTLASEYREFRNKLQVMDMMAAAGKGEALGGYIQEVAEEIRWRNRPDHPDPIIKATLLSWRIRAQERGISIIEHNKTAPVKTKPQRMAGEILSMALGFLVEEASRLRCNKIILSREEKKENTGFRLQLIPDEQKKAIKVLEIFPVSAEILAPLADLLAKANGRLEIIANGIIIWLP